MTNLSSLLPPADVVSTLAALPRPDVPGVRWSAPSCSRAAECLATWPGRRSALYGRPTRCSSSPTGRGHTTSGFDDLAEFRLGG
jgi:hypothetical protein